jgi:hypothetical protein
MSNASGQCLGVEVKLTTASGQHCDVRDDKRAPQNLNLNDFLQHPTSKFENLLFLASKIYGNHKVREEIKGNNFSFGIYFQILTDVELKI